MVSVVLPKANEYVLAAPTVPVAATRRFWRTRATTPQARCKAAMITKVTAAGRAQAPKAIGATDPTVKYHR